MPKLPIPVLRFPDRKFGLFNVPFFARVDGEEASLLSNQHITNYNTIILDSDAIPLEILKLTRADNISNVELTQDVFEKVKSSFEKRLLIIDSLVREGATLIIIMRSALPQVKYQSRRQGIQKFDLNKLPIFRNIRQTPVRGSSVKYVGPNLHGVRDFFMSEKFYYQVAFTGADVTPLLLAPSILPGETKCVAGYIKTSDQNGVTVFMPPIEAWTETLATSSSRRLAFVSRLLEIAEHVISLKKSEIPQWANSFFLKEEAELRSHSVELKRQVKQLQAEITAISEELDSREWYKLLFTAKDEPLENAVKRALKKMGVRCEKGPNYRADLLALHNDTVTVIEVKGFENAAKQSAIAQCTEWVAAVTNIFSLPVEERREESVQYAEVLDRLGITTPIEEGAELPYKIKGVILANTFRDKLVSDRPSMVTRPQNNFPDNFQTGLERAGLVALLGLQLLGLCDLHRRDPEQARKAIDRLLATDGVFTECSDWTSFLSEVESEE